MLVIRKAQESVFNEIAENQFVQQIKEMMLKDWPEEFEKLSDSEPERFISRQLYTARRVADFHTEYDLSRYMVITMALEEVCWHAHEWAKAIIADESLAPSHKMNLLWQHVEDAMEQWSADSQ